MAIPVVASFTKSTSAPSQVYDLAVDIPAGTQVGDLLVAFGNVADNSATCFVEDTPGWTQLCYNGDYQSEAFTTAFWRIADGTEGASMLITSQKYGYHVRFCLRITGAESVELAFNSGIGYHNSGNTISIPTGTTTVADCLGLATWSHDGSDGIPWTMGGGAVLLTSEGGSVSWPSPSTSGTAAGVLTRDLSTPGSHADSTAYTAKSDGMACCSLIVKPEAAAVPILGSASIVNNATLTATGFLEPTLGKATLYNPTTMVAEGLHLPLAKGSASLVSTSIVKAHQTLIFPMWEPILGAAELLNNTTFTADGNYIGLTTGEALIQSGSIITAAGVIVGTIKGSASLLATSSITANGIVVEPTLGERLDSVEAQLDAMEALAKEFLLPQDLQPLFTGEVIFDI